MNISINGSGCLIPVSPVPDAILALAYPYFTVEDAPDGGLWLTLSPYSEVYDEDAIRQFLTSLLPYIGHGTISCTVVAQSGNTTVFPPNKWSFEFRNEMLFRCYEGTGSYSSSSCISE